MSAKQLRLLFRAVFCGFLGGLREVTGKVLVRFYGVGPFGKGKGGVGARVAGRFYPDFVPEDFAVELGEGNAVDLGLGLESDFLGVYGETDPFSGLGQFSHFDFPNGVFLAIGNERFAPIRTVFPSSVVELKHDLLGRVDGVEKHVGEKLVFVGGDFVGRFGLPKEMLVVAGAFADN